jgi:truncated hemoglobin YjbI
MPSLYVFAGGEEALHRLEDSFYGRVLQDPLLLPLFGDGRPEHVDHSPRLRPNASVVPIASPGSLALPI